MAPLLPEESRAAHSHECAEYGSSGAAYLPPRAYPCVRGGAPLVLPVSGAGGVFTKGA